MTTKRLNIPDDVKLKLWAQSGGRCEFPGCNELVYRDGLTLKEDNFAHMAHIVAASPSGPRGDTEESPELQVDFDNLMLLCFDHHKLIDGKNATHYTIEQLREHKQNHEDRIRRQTAVGPEYATTVVRFQANIRDRRVEVSVPQAYEALHPRFPADDKGVLLDFTGKAGTGNQSFWEGFAKEISEHVQHALRRGNNEQRYAHLSVFALGPIPVLIHLGNQIGNIIPVDLFQKHRDTDDWKWKAEPTDDPFEYHLVHTEGKDSSKVALVLSLSGKIAEAEYRSIIGDAPVYEMEIDTPGPEFLQYRSRLDKFRVLYRTVISEIRQKYGDGCEIHLFPAIPAPVAVLCGKELLPKSDPRLLVYDNDKNQGGFVPTLTIT